MESFLQDIPGAGDYLDDILVLGKTKKGHLEVFEQVLSCLEEVGL